MKKNKAVIISCILIGLGVVMSVAGYISGGYKELKDRNGFVIEWNNSGDKNQSIKIDEQLEEFNSIDLDKDFGDIEIDEGDNYRIAAEYNEEKQDLSYSIKDGKLVVTQKTFANIQKKIKIFDFENDESNCKITVYVPKESKLDNLKLNINFGNTNLKNLKCRELVVTSKFGNVEGSNIEAINFHGELESGSFNLDKFTSENSVMKSKFGHIKGKDFVTNGMNLNVESGKIDITGKLSGKNNINSDFGSINLKNNLPKEDCGYDIEMDFGKCVIDGNKIKGDHEYYNEGSNNIFKVKSNSGSVELDFNK